MSCPICGRIECDHSPSERGQSHDQMMGDYYRGAGVPVQKVRESFPEYKEDDTEKKEQEK